MEFYVWDIVNAKEIENNPKARPHLVERGPFVWLEERDKGDIVENNNGTISFKQINTWTRFVFLMNDSRMDTAPIKSVNLRFSLYWPDEKYGLHPR